MRLTAFRIGLFWLVVVLCTSCIGDLLFGGYESTAINYNSAFYGTEWSTNDNTNGLKFYSDDTVLFFAGTTNIKGKFTYYPPEKTKDVGLIVFDGLTITTSPQAEITMAGLMTDTSLKVIWHKLGDSENLYMMMYKRR